jgi:hypothetical protein
MAGTEHARGKAPEVAGMPEEAITDALEWMRITYALDYAAKGDSWDRPEDYPQLWTVRAYDSDQIWNWTAAPFTRTRRVRSPWRKPVCT